MAKYYVQSGTARLVIAADDPTRAALWLVHRAMQQVVPVYDDPELSPDEKGQVAAIQGLMVLGNQIRLNELGFDRDDGDTLDTFDTVIQWHQLMIALSRLDSMLDVASVPDPFSE
jgi:hypothetical protein